MDETPKIQVEELPYSAVTTADPHQGEDLSHRVLTHQFNIDLPNKTEDNKLSEIWEFGKTLSKTGELTDIIWQIKHLELTLGAPRLGESRLDRLYRYAKLTRQSNQINEELRNL